MFQRGMLTILLFFVSVSLASAFLVPDTGITECYDADGNQIFPCPGPGEDYYGQDGNVIRNSMSYTDNGDETLTDSITDLLWQQSDDGATRNWTAADGYCNTLNINGITGWRLPTLVELDSIMDLSVDSGAAIYPIFTGTAAAGYWSSSDDSFNTVIPDNAWILDFGTTEDNIVAKTATNYTRCVREVAP